jgi:hypothetical protein
MFTNFLSGYLTICGGAMLLAGAWLLTTRTRLWLRGERTIGEISAYTPRLRSRPGEQLHYMPHVRFVEKSGKAREFVSTTSADPGKWPVGTSVPVSFDRDDPHKAEITTPILFWRGPAGVLIFAVALLAAALKVGS